MFIQRQELLEGTLEIANLPPYFVGKKGPDYILQEYSSKYTWNLY
jgi:hypothetical protein